MSNNEAFGLRAEAPVFVPTSGSLPSAKLGTQNLESTQEQASKSKRNRRRPNNKNKQPQHQIPNENCAGCLPGEGRPRRGWGGVGDSQSKLKRAPNAGRRSRGKKGGRQAQNIQSVHETISEVDTNDTADEISSTLPLHEESVFPSLGGSFPVSSKPGAKTVPATNWLNVENKRSVLHAPPSLVSSKASSDETEDDGFAALGLQKLSSKRTTTAPKKLPSAEFLSFDVEQQTEESEPTDVALVGVDSNSSGIMPDQLQKLPVRTRRPQWNMNRLRDKWWDALDHLRMKKNMMTELQQVLKGRFVEPEDYGVPLESSSTMDEVKVGMPVFGENAEDPSLPETSPLQSLLEDHGNDPISSGVDILEQILRANDAAAFEKLLNIWQGSSDAAELPLATFLQRVRYALRRIIQLDLSRLLHVVLKQLSENQSSWLDNGSAEVANALMLAARLGHEDCVSLILTRWGKTSGLFTFQDDDGNSVLHHCCQGQGSTQLLQMLIRHISGGAKAKRQQFSKVLLAKNNSHQSALHLACEGARVDLVEVFLSECSTALLTKLLVMEDDRSQTPLLAAVGANASDVVMCLIMWRGNQNLFLGRFEAQLPPCPLLCAATHGNLDMIHLLLQFSNPSGKEYQVTRCISALLLSNASSDVKVEGCEILIQDGGNPFANVGSQAGAPSFASTAVSVAAKMCESVVLHSLVSNGLQQLHERQQNRRKDPKLRQQPESFFKGIECKEDFEKERALADALVESLYRGWESSESSSGGEEELWRHLAAAATLFMSGACLKGKDKARLHVSIHEKYLKPAALFSDEPSSHCYVTSFTRQARIPSKKRSKVNIELDRSPLSIPSRLLLQMGWFQECLPKNSCCCAWISDESSGHRSIHENVLKQWKDDLVTLISNDGAQFVVHDAIVSAASAKLASALRFVSMKEETNADTESDDDKKKKRVLHLDVPSQHCAWMLQHIYHGSIVCGWSDDRKEHCHEILELMLVAEEFLCFSLLQECEMRLLHARPDDCFCWSCARAVRWNAAPALLPEEDMFAECLYLTHGPSQLLNGNTVLDVLAVLQDLEILDLPYETYQVAKDLSLINCMPPAKLWEQNDTSSTWSRRHQAIRSLKNAAIDTILDYFPQVVHSSSFQENTDWNESTNDNLEGTTMAKQALSQRVLLLQMCLEELSATEPPKMFERYYKSGLKQ